MKEKLPHFFPHTTEKQNPSSNNLSLYVDGFKTTVNYQEDEASGSLRSKSARQSFMNLVK